MNAPFSIHSRRDSQNDVVAGMVPVQRTHVSFIVPLFPALQHQVLITARAGATLALGIVWGERAKLDVDPVDGAVEREHVRH